MAEQQVVKWELGRFLKTLIDFEVIPFVGCLKRLLTSQKRFSTQQLEKMKVFLVLGSVEPVGHKVVNYLLENHYSVRYWGQDITQAKTILGEQVEIWQGDLAALPSVIDGVGHIIYCTGIDPHTEQSQIDNLLKSLKEYPNLTRQILFDFTKDSTELQHIWGALDDVVMGGVSKSQLLLTSDKAIFSGDVSTANSGGFASVRTRNLHPPLDLAAYQGIQLEVKGDGNRYKFIIRDQDKWDGLGYCYSFTTSSQNWLTVNIPFNELIPVFRAKTVPEAGILNTSKISSLQLMLSKFEYDGALNPQFSPGLFNLEIKSIQAYSEELPLVIVTPETIINPENLKLD